MIPPPLPPRRVSTAQQCASASLATPLLAIFIGIIFHAATAQTPPPKIVLLLVGLVCFALIGVGLIAAIIGLCGVRENGPQGILGKSIVGLIFNAAFLILFGLGAFVGYQKAVKSRQTSGELMQNLNSTAQEIHDQAQKSYNPKTGITNVNFASLQKMQGQLDNAQQSLSGDDLIISQVMSRYLARMQVGLKKYQSAIAQLRANHVLTTSNLTDRAQIAPRRETVQNFQAANAALKNIITNSENSIRADLDTSKITPQKKDDFIAGFDAKFAPRRDLDVQIRDCDERMAASMLAMLNILETNWGRWHFDHADGKVYFDDGDARIGYMQSLNQIKIAGQEQVILQGELVNLK